MKKNAAVIIFILFLIAGALTWFSRTSVAECKPGDAICGAPQASEQQTVLYRCPMHPEVTSDKPGKCPKCGMFLEKVTEPTH